MNEPSNDKDNQFDRTAVDLMESHGPMTDKFSPQPSPPNVVTITPKAKQTARILYSRNNPRVAADGPHIDVFT